MKQLLLSIFLAAGAAVGAATPWMAELPDNLKVRQMSIPGAHDAATKGLSSYGACQSKTIADLWEEGVRAFDLRPKKNGTIYHGIYSTGVKLTDALNTLKEKLETDAEDFAIVFIKDEGGEGSSWISFIEGVLPTYDNIIAQFNPEMTLADARGKIILVTRDEITSYGKAAFAGNWGDNQAFKEGIIRVCGSSSNTQTWIQDHYDKVANDTKVTEVKAMLDQATNNHRVTFWVFNHTSGYTSGGLIAGGNSYIQANAKAANKGAYEYLVAKPAGRAGIVFMDYAGDDSNSYYGKSLVDALIARNSVEVPMSGDEMISFFNNKSNWTYGAAAKGIGTTGQKDATMVESYRDDAYGTGVVMTASCDGVANGDYMVNIAAHANWTPGRGSITTAKVADGTLGCTVLKINGSSVDLPINHNTGLPNPVHMYSVPVSVTDGTMTITFENVRAGANWFTSYVQSIYPLVEGETVMLQDFQNNFMGWNSTTGATNQGRKGGSSELSSTTCWENWIKDSAPFTGKMYSRNVVPNGRYRVSLDVTSRTVDGDNIYFYANEERQPLTTIDQEHHSAEITVTDNVIEYGLKFDTPKANWAGVDNARIELLALADTDEFAFALGSAAHHFKAAHSWNQGEAFLGGNLGYKNDIYVETWRSSAGERPDGEVIYSTAENVPNGNYMMGLYAFSCNTGAEQYPDGDMTTASVSLNNKEYFIPTHNSSDVPSLHEFYWLPVSVTEGTLRVGINGYGYPNWFGIDVISLVPVTDGEDLTLPVEGPVNNYGHGKNMFASEMNVAIQNNVIKGSDNTYSPDEPMYENWHPSAYTGRFVSRIYVPEGEYEMGLDCFAEKIDDNLNDYYMFANEVRTPKTKGSGFETLKAKVKVGKSAGKMRAAAAVDALYPIEYGFGIDAAATQWTGIKNPTMVRLADTPTSVGEIEAGESADEHIYSISGVCVGEGEETLRSLTPGLYIYKGKKIYKF